MTFGSSFAAVYQMKFGNNGDSAGASAANMCSTDDDASPDMSLIPLAYSNAADRLRPRPDYDVSPLTLRQLMPAKFFAVVERVLTEGRFVISLADSGTSLRLMQRELTELFQRLEHTMKPAKELVPGGYYLYKESDSAVFRVQFLDGENSMVTVYMLDFARFTTANAHSLYEFTEAFFEDPAWRFPFTARVVLPNDETLRSLGLPTSKMIREGDIVDVITFTTQEPHLAVFGFARSLSRRILPTNFLDGFDENERRNWSSLFTSINSVIKSPPTILKKGYGRLSGRDTHVNRLALVAYTKSLDKVYVRDMESAIRLTFLREVMKVIYGREATRAQFALKDTSELCFGAGLVAYKPDRDAYIRVEVLSVGNEKVEVTPVDELNAGIFSALPSELFKIPAALDFPRQVFSVRMARHSDGQVRYHLSGLARCVLPDCTPVLLDSEPEFGLVKVRCANAPRGVLSKICFPTICGDKKLAPADITTMIRGFGEKLLISRTDDIEQFAQSVSKPLTTANPSRGILKKK